ncbi:MAG: hypothetical protein JSW23_04915, partial [Planctomycetota bacterium]
TTQVTDNNYDDVHPRISGTNVVWEGNDVYSWEIFFWDGNTTERLTYNELPDYGAEIWGTYVVWQRHDGNDDEIFFHDVNSGQTAQFTDNIYNDYEPEISGLRVVWKGHDGNDWEIYMAVVDCLYTLEADLNRDCKVDFEDFALFCEGWLECTKLEQEDCWE